MLNCHLLSISKGMMCAKISFPRLSKIVLLIMATLLATASGSDSKQSQQRETTISYRTSHHYGLQRMAKSNVKEDVQCALKTVQAVVNIPDCDFSPIVDTVNDFSNINDVSTFVVALLNVKENSAREVMSFCDPKCGQPVVDALESCGATKTAQTLVQMCASNNISQPCFTKTDDFFRAEIRIEKECNIYPRYKITNVTANKACQTALGGLKQSIGCCASLYNTSFVRTLDPKDLLFNTNIFASALWGGNNVTTLRACNVSTLTNAAPPPHYLALLTLSLLVTLASVVIV